MSGPLIEVTPQGGSDADPEGVFYALKEARHQFGVAVEKLLALSGSAMLAASMIGDKMAGVAAHEATLHEGVVAREQGLKAREDVVALREREMASHDENVTSWEEGFMKLEDSLRACEEKAKDEAATLEIDRRQQEAREREEADGRLKHASELRLS